MKATRVWIATLLLLGSVTFVAPTELLAQSGTGTISGMLQDTNGNAVSGLVVRATDVLDPTRSYDATSDALGAFSITNIPPGSYLVSARTASSLWIAKDTSPLVDVKARATSEVSIILMRMPMGGAAAPAAGGSSKVATIGMIAGLSAAGLGVYSVVKTSSNSDDIDELREDFEEFKREFASEFRRR